LAGSPSYVNQALRTLRRLLGKAVEWKVIAVAPTVRLMEEVGRELTIDPETEAKLLAVAKQPLKDVLVVIQDTGMRPEEVFRIRIENIDWSRRLIFNPNGKTKAARRHVPISERMLDLLSIRCSNKPEGWLFPSRRAECGHLTTVAKQFRDARTEAGLPESLVLYCARHAFGRAVYGATGKSRDGDERHGPHRCPYCDAVPASGVGFCARSHRSEKSTSQTTSQRACGYSEDSGK
jgi:integrase